MRKVKINTTQNVIIEYEVALLQERIMAYFIDLFILLSFIGIFSYLSFATLSSAISVYVSYLIIIPFFLFYSLASEIFLNGQSLGKRAINIKIVKLNGTEPQINDYILRWVFRMVDIYLSSGIVAALFIKSSGTSQRLGDLAAETTIIRLRPSKPYSFDSIKKIKTKSDYEPRFPEVRKLSEENALLIKMVLDRYNQYPNRANREVVQMLIQKIKNKLDIDQGKIKDTDFLRMIIKEYVVQTR